MESSIKTSPTESLFYREFDTRIKVVKLPRKFHFNFSKFDTFGKTRYRVVKSYRSRHEYDCNLYTSSIDIIQDILDNPELEVTELTKPLNEAHKELLHKRDRKVVIRKRLWFNKYKHKISAWHNWDKSTTRDESLAMIRWVTEHFPKGENRLVSANYGYGFGFSRDRVIQPPTIFTNSEESMMLFKLAYSDMLRMTMETCITLQELDN